MKKTSEDWFRSAESDLALIGEIINKPELTHLSAFHAQQAIEKCFKAIIEEYDLVLSKIHSLETLYGYVNDKFHYELDTSLLKILDQLYIDARYPGELGLLPNGKPSLTEIGEIYKFALQIYHDSRQACSAQL